MVPQLFQGSGEVYIRLRPVLPGNFNLGHHLVGDTNIFVGFIFCRSLPQSQRKLLGFFQVALPEPVLSGCSLQANIVTPPEPRISREYLADFMEGGDSFVSFTGMGVIVTEID